jgi:hypothetical protein
MVDENGTTFTEILAVNPDGTGDITGTNILGGGAMTRVRPRCSLLS